MQAILHVLDYKVVYKVPRIFGCFETLRDASVFNYLICSRLKNEVHFSCGRKRHGYP